MSAAPGAVAVIDIGKTNAKVVLVDEGGAEIEAARHPNEVRPGPPYPHHDVPALEAFVLGALAAMAPRVRAVVPVTHGACAALVTDGGDLALPVLDYEHAPSDMRTGYAPPPFAETGAPPMAGGLNLGAQLHWLARAHPEGFARARWLLTWPQWWAWRLSGVMASEATSLGCHTEIWNPQAGAPSSLARARGWDALLPPLRHASDALGPVTPEVAAATGLDPTVRVHCGIHDSNASLLPYLDGEGPCAVVSTGTWVVSMALGAPVPDLAGAADVLLNCDAHGRPVPTALFMGGRLREEALAAGQSAAEADAAAGRRTAERLAVIGARGPVHVEGPFAASRAFVDALREATGRPVHARTEGAGTTRGAAMLAG